MHCGRVVSALRADENAKEFLPDLGEGWWANRWKEKSLPAEGRDWQERIAGTSVAKFAGSVQTRDIISLT